MKRILSARQWVTQRHQFEAGRPKALDTAPNAPTAKLPVPQKLIAQAQGPLLVANR
jgi:hypothetical protein